MKKIQEACTVGSNQACVRTSYMQVTGFVGSAGGGVVRGIAGAKVATAFVGGIALAFGVTFGAPALAINRSRWRRCRGLLQRVRRRRLRRICRRYYLSKSEKMSDVSILERIFFLGWLVLFVAGGFNGIYICFHGIRRLDPYFSQLANTEWEPHSPFDSFCRMHRYTFGVKRPNISNAIAAWLYFTCISLIVYWISMLIGFLGHQFGINILE